MGHVVLKHIVHNAEDSPLKLLRRLRMYIYERRDVMASFVIKLQVCLKQHGIHTELHIRQQQLRQQQRLVCTKLRACK